MENVYLASVERSLPRVLALFDTDETSETFGFGDRFHWAWGLIDFGNGTFQGVAHGLARLTEAGILPDFLSEKAVLRLIDAMLTGAKKLTRADGSLEEAFPYEGSFCVTALVAYDLLTAIELLKSRFEPTRLNEYYTIIRPMIRYLHTADENHAFISNHLATSVAALVKWSKLTGEEGESRGKEILERILSKQSQEGWYLEYEGADPGYQSLCTYYLCDVYSTTKDETLKASLLRSVEFIQYFVHPDGSFGGTYGSRNTRFYYPSGFECLSEFSESSAAISQFMRQHIANNNVVTLDAIDEPNLIPVFNSYCWAAAYYSKNAKNECSAQLPFESESDFQHHFSEAGIIVDKRSNLYSIVSLFKGGCIYQFRGKNLVLRNDGVMCKSSSGKLYSSQSYNKENTYNLSADSVTVRSFMQPVAKRRFSPFKMFVLRGLNITLMRSYLLRELAKKILVKLLIKGSTKKIANLERTIHFNEIGHIEDNIEGKASLTSLDVSQFVAIHMASKGYWQRQDTSEN
jgi:hypothetical protein